MLASSPRFLQPTRPRVGLLALVIACLAALSGSVAPAQANQPHWWVRKSLKSASAPQGSSAAIQRRAGPPSGLVAEIGQALAVTASHRPRDLSAGEALSYGNRLMTSGHQQAAAGAWLAALDADPGLAAAWANLGSLLRHDGHLRLALKSLEEAVRAESWNGLAWFNIALCREGRDDLVGADAAYLKALEVAPQLWDPNVNPLIIGNDRATRALHRQYLRSFGSQGVTIDEGPAQTDAASLP